MSRYLKCTHRQRASAHRTKGCGRGCYWKLVDVPRLLVKSFETETALDLGSLGKSSKLLVTAVAISVRDDVG